MTKRKNVLSIIAVAGLLVSVFAGTYAFFTANSTPAVSSSASITTGSLTLMLDDATNKGLTSGGAITPTNLSYTTYLSIRNDSPIDVKARILFRGLTNTYSEYLVYSLEQVEAVPAGNSEATVVKTIVSDYPVPTANNENKKLADGLNITAGQTQYYKLTIHYQYSDTVNQTSDLSATFYTGFTIEEGESQSRKTLLALNLTESSGTPIFSMTSPSTVTDVCLYNERVVSTNTTSSACQNIYKINGVADGFYELYDSTQYNEEFGTTYSLSYLSHATWNSSTNKCMYGDIEVYTARSLLQYLQNGSMPYSFENACTDVYSANVGGQDLIATGIQNIGEGTFVSSITQSSGVYEAEDDYGTSYYFRGNVTNNYVKFGKNSNNQDMWWRIIRINGDGSLRLLYDGTSAHTTGDDSMDRRIGDYAFNANYDDAKYEGYMYGGNAGVASTSYAQAVLNETPSTIKGVLDNWYTQNIENTGYASYISDEVFCNDRSIAPTAGPGYGNNLTFYNTEARLNSSYTPTLKCTQKNDAFTVSDTTLGNGALSKPIGLITADEIAYAGGKDYTDNEGYYLNKGFEFWTLSPGGCGNGNAFTWSVNSGNLSNWTVYNYGAVVPVINLGTEYSQQLTGSGTAANPFVLN